MRVWYKTMLNPWICQETDAEFKKWYFFLRIGMLVILFIAIKRLLQLSTSLSPESYQKPVILFEFLENILNYWQTLPLIAALLIGAFFFRKNLSTPWGQLPGAKFIRLLVMLATVVLGWAFATYDFNLYFNQAHYVDRLLLCALILLVYWRPFFVLPFLMVLLPVMHQFNTLPGFSSAATLIPLNTLILFSAFFSFYSVTRIFHLQDFAFLTGCLFAASYWLSGYGKLTTDWLIYDQIYFLMPATYANGWLAGLDPDTISFIVQKMAPFNASLKILVIGVELGLLFLFYHHRWMIILIIGSVLLHIGIFLVSGIFLWMWAVMGIGLLICFTQKDGLPAPPKYSMRHILTSVILIAGGIYWCDPPRLAWYDSPVNYTYRYKAITENHETYNLPPSFFAPYDYQFTLGKFSYLSQEPSLPISWGATQNAYLVKKLAHLDLSQVLAYANNNGTIRFDSTETGKFDYFLTQYIRHWNKRLSNETIFSDVQAPRQLWTYPKGPVFNQPRRIDQVVITRVTSVFKNNEYLEIQEIPIRKIKIPS